MVTALFPSGYVNDCHRLRACHWSQSLPVILLPLGFIVVCCPCLLVEKLTHAVVKGRLLKRPKEFGHSFFQWDYPKVKANRGGCPT